MPEYINGLAVDSSLIDGLAVDDTYGLASSGQQGISVDTGFYSVTPIFDTLMSGSEPFVSGSEPFVSSYDPYNIGIRKNKIVRSKTLKISGPAEELTLDSSDTTLYVGGGYTFALSLLDAYPVRTTKIVPVTKANFNIVKPSVLGISKIIGVVPTGVYNSRKEPIGLAVDSSGTTFSFGNSLLSVSQFNAFDPVVHRTVRVRKGEININTYNFDIKTKGRVILDPLIFAITPYPVNVRKTNVFNISNGAYELKTFSVNTKKYSTYVEGKYIKDSANYYQLYVDQGIHYSILIETQNLEIEDNSSYQFVGKFGKHTTSFNKYDIQCTKLTPYLLRLDIAGEDTAGLYGRFNFDIVGTRNNISTVVMTGAVIIKEMVLA